MISVKVNLITTVCKRLKLRVAKWILLGKAFYCCFQINRKDFLIARKTVVCIYQNKVTASVNYNAYILKVLDDRDLKKNKKKTHKKTVVSTTVVVPCDGRRKSCVVIHYHTLL